MLKIGERVLTPGGHKGTVIDILGDTTVEVELDFGGLMHYCSGALTNSIEDLPGMNDYTYEQFSKDCDRW